MGVSVENIFFIEQVKNFQQQLAQAEKLAAIGRFAASIAHEVKNPLTPIKTFTEYLPQKYQDKEFVDKYSKIVSSEVNRIDSLMHQLLDFSKPSPLQLAETDIRKLIDDTLELLSNEFIKHSIKVEKNYPLPPKADPPLAGNATRYTLKVDSQRLKQAFLNFFLNAIDAMPSGGTLTVSTSIEHLGSSIEKSVLICVQDTGCGIPEENLARIFEPFFSTKERGTGLGLAIVYSIIKEHNGLISVESQIDKGTKFTIELPMAK